MQIYQVVEMLEKVNETSLKKCTLKKNGETLKEYEGNDLAFLRKWFYEVASLEVKEFGYDTKTNEATISI